MKKSAFNILLLFILFCFGSFNYIGKTSRTGLNIGDKAPYFVATTTDGATISAQDYTGKVILLNFWASYDPQSRMGQISYNPIYEKYNKGCFIFGESFEIVSISTDRYASLIDLSARKDGILWQTQLSDVENNHQLSSAFENPENSQNFLLDGKGNILAKNLNAEELNNILSEFQVKKSS